MLEKKTKQTKSPPEAQVDLTTLTFYKPTEDQTSDLFACMKKNRWDSWLLQNSVIWFFGLYT